MANIGESIKKPLFALEKQTFARKTTPFYEKNSILIIG